MLRRVALVRTDSSEEHIASIIRVTRVSALRKTLAVTKNCSTMLRNIVMVFLRREFQLLVPAKVVLSSPIFSHSDNEGDKFLRNTGSYKNHTA
jgi:hypothetical protein